jgi:predicted O-methyltransferase YrrM
MSLDLPEGKFGGGYPEWKTKLYNKFALPEQELDLLRADSHHSESFSMVKSHFDGADLDYLFIDGDHSYEGVKKDYEMYSPLVRKGGIIAFHDIIEHKGSECKVDEFWREVKEGKDSKEFVNDYDQGQYGIGILYN